MSSRLDSGGTTANGADAPRTGARRDASGARAARWAGGIVVIVALAACGGGGSGSTTDPTAGGGATTGTGTGTGGGAGGGVPPVGFRVGGTIAGATGTLQLALNGVSQTFSGSNFQFSSTVPAAASYAVTVVSAAAGTVCTVRNGVGTASSDVTDIQVACMAQTAVIRAAAAQVVGTMDTGDYNGDGHRDVAFVIRTLDGHPAGGNNHFVRYLMGTGTGAFLPPVDVPTICSAVPIVHAGRWAVTADFNQDGVDDFYCHGPDTGFQIVGGSKTGAPTVLANLPFEGSSYNVAPFDVDRDGYPDVFGTGPSGGPSLSPFSVLPSGPGGFGPARFFAGAGVGLFGGGGSSGFELGDFNGDGVVDVLAVTNTCPITCATLGLFAGRGPNEFAWTATSSAIPASTAAGRPLAQMYWGLASGDVDGDGDRDVVTTSTTTFVQVMLNDGTGRLAPGESVTVGNAPGRVALVDMDADGLLDIVSADASSRTLTVAFGLGSGRFGAPTTPGGRWKQVRLDSRASIQGLRIVDLNGNGYPDIVIVENGTPGSGGFGLGSVVVALDVGR